VLYPTTGPRTNSSTPTTLTEKVAGGYQYFGNARRLKVGYLSMSVNHRHPLLETRRLLDQRPASYSSTNDVNSEDPPPANTEPLQAVTSRIDLWCILVGIWMGSMLSSFDGMYCKYFSRSPCVRNLRDRHGYSLNADWERIQRFT